MLSENFSSVGYLDDNRICVVEEDEEEDVGLIFTKTDGKGATKWTEIEIPKVTLIKISPSKTTNDNYVMVSCDFDNPINQAGEDCDEEAELPEELARLLKQDEKVIQPHEESVEVINLVIARLCESRMGYKLQVHSSIA
ncbi:hypothetical protein KIW84_041393 [Lathyrus oleraceus]|uniref:Uncharacterized protein n=1 Tax=Pisum sativum TaxID=3888 RepID=A0A9D5ARI1_PEA|nr:hypothetical protein KIW84_041393 [Pisum sativum]